jgi:hypothetical protein
VTEDDDALAALARQAGDLRGVAAQCQALVTARDARLVTEGTGGTLMLRLEVRQLRERLDEAPGKRQLKPAAETEADAQPEIGGW